MSKSIRLFSITLQKIGSKENLFHKGSLSLKSGGLFLKKVIYLAVHLIHYISTR